MGKRRSAPSSSRQRLQPDPAVPSDRYHLACFEAAIDAMLIADDRGCYVDANPAACALFGLPKEALLGCCIADFAQREFDFEQAWQAFLAQGQERGEFALVRPDGTVREVEYAATANIAPHYHLSILRDVTERRQLERQVQQLNQELEQRVMQRTAALEQANQALQATNQRLAAEIQQRERAEIALACAEDGMWDWNVETNAVYFSPQWKAMLGYADDEIGQTLEEWERRIHPDDRDRVYAALQEHFERKKNSYQNEYRLLAKDGTWKWVLDRGKVVAWKPDGTPLRVIGTHVDITARKQLEQALEASRAELTSILNNSFASIAKFRLFSDSTVICDYYSPHSEVVYGYSPQELLEKPDLWRSRVLPEDWETILFPMIQAVFAGQTQFTLEYRFRHRDGSVRWLREVATAEWQAHQNAWVLTTLVTDITDRKTTEQALENTRQLLQLVLEHLPIAVFAKDAQTLTFTLWNRACTELMGYSPEQALGKTDYDLFPINQAEVCLAYDREALRSGCVVEIPEETIVGADGRPRIIHNKKVAVYDTDGQPRLVIGMAEDITEQKRAQMLILQQAERERVLRSITQHIRQFLDVSQVLDTAVHDIRQLLQVDRALIYRFCPDWSGDMIAESVADPSRAILGSHIFDPCFKDNLIEPYRQGKISRISDIEEAQLPTCHVQLLASFEVRANLVVPIVTQDSLWGLLCVHYCSYPHDWQDWEIDLLRQITDQLAIAIQQSELHEQLQQWAATLEQQVQERTAEIQRTLDLGAMLQRITERARNSLDEDQILETVVQELGQVLDLECCDTGIYNADRTTSTITHEFTRSRCSAQGTTFPLVDTHHYNVYTALFQGMAVQFCDLTPCVFRQDCQGLTVLACPIIDDQQVLGDLWLYRHTAFTPAEMQLVQQVSNQCAIALRQSRLYQAVQAQVIELERLNRLKDDFLSTVSHELRTPMSNIKMATQMLEISLGRLGILANEATPIHRYFNVLREEGQREINLINDLLDLTRVDAGMETLNPTTIELPRYLPSLTKPFVERTREQHQQLVLEIPADLPPVTMDCSYLERILTELLHNACKYTPPHETITLSAQATTTALTIQVSNSGVEIPILEHDRVFDRFYRIPNNDPWKHGGTGLGLALVKKLVERLGGTIRVESGNDQTTFVLTFPLTIT